MSKKVEREAKKRLKFEEAAKKEMARVQAEKRMREEAEARSRMAPMTKEMWEQQQSVVRKVYDEDTGRTRLVKGDGEILEECVSQFRHKEINKAATQADGDSFQNAVNATVASK